MNNTDYCNTFTFKTFIFSSNHYTDNRKGIDTHYIARLKRGTSKFIYKERSYNFKSGDIFYLPKGLCYQSYWYGDDEGVIEFDSISFKLFPDKSKKKYAFQKLKLDENGLELLDKISTSMSVDCRNVGYLYLLLDSFIDNLKYEAILKQNQVITMAREFMQNTTNYTISDVAKYCHVSESGLYSIFRKKCGHTPIDERHIIVVNNAIELLQTTDTPISEIINILGFSSEPYFRKIFFKITGKTPRQIRNETTRI